MDRLKIFNEVKGFRVPRRRLLKVFKRFLKLGGVGSRFEVNLVFAGEKMIAELNENWKGRKGSTDVLSFEYEAGGGKFRKGKNRKMISGEKCEGKGKKGEIYICMKVAERNALEFGKTLTDEILGLFAHGLLHLKGYTHETDKKYEKMMGKTGKIVERI